MKASIYLKYTLRSLLRGGQHTLLAVFCVTVGVMAVVALQLVGFMLQHSLATNAREANGGDIAVIAEGAPLQTKDLNTFEQLKQAGTITGYTAITRVSGTLNNADASVQAFTLEAVDPNAYPLVSPPAFVQPNNATVASLLTDSHVLVTEHFLSTYHKHAGDIFNVYVKTPQGIGQTLTITIAGVIANSGTFAQAGNLMLVSAHDYQGSTTALNYTLVNINTADQAHTDSAVKAINAQFPLVTTQTATDVLKGQQSSIDLVNKFLEIAGLIALLIGGVGIVNTMQVLLSRRKTEIAMLKTAGYQRKDLYLLFGLEAGLLGLLGGMLGAVIAIGVSALIRTLLESLGSNVPFALSPGLLISGVVVGCVTALIFGLLPIVQAAQIRPLHVLRELEQKSTSGRIQTILLLVLFSLLFCLLAIVILNNNVALGIGVTYGTFVVLLLLSGLFSLIVLAVGKLPVPEHVQIMHILLVLLGLAIALLIYQFLPVFGIFLLMIALLGVVVPFLPKQWKVNVKMALRNLNRRRARTTTTLLALFIGIYGLGVDIGFGQDLSSLIGNTLAQNTPYNLVATTTGKDADTLRAHIDGIRGVSASREDPYTMTLPLAINGQPTKQIIPGSALQQDLSQLGGIEGYDLAHTLPAQKITEGRNLTAQDANTNHVLVSQIMTSKGWAQMNLKVGDTITLSSLDGRVRKDVEVVGIISVPTSFETLGKVLVPTALVNDLSSGNYAQTSVFYMKVASNQVDQALHDLNNRVPNASVQNLSDAATSFTQQVSSFLNVIIGVASLSVIAGLIIIANSVALAMLERRRELGILKSVGYTSSTILGQVMIESGITGGIGAFIATLLAAGGVALGSKFFFQNNLILNMQPEVIVSMLVLPTLFAILTAVLVAWNAVRVRPLLVLKYE